MKNLKILFIAAISLVSFNSCDEEDDNIFEIQSSESTAAIINLPTSGTGLVLDISNPTGTATTIVWEDATYNIPTVINNTIQLAIAGTNFETPFDVVTTTNNYLAWTNEELNGIAVGLLGLTPFTSADVDMRIKSSIGDNDSEAVYSEMVTVSLTPYTTEAPKLGVPGNHQGWDPASAPSLFASAYGETDYEGYVWLDGQHKFIATNDEGDYAWGNTDWGDASGTDGSYTQVLIEDGEGNIAPPNGAGYYFVQANTDADVLEYSETLHNWAVVGSATGSWDNDTDMTYDSATSTWTITMDLTAEEIKFRSNDTWDWNYGDDEGDGILELASGTNIPVPSAGNYTIVLDFSTPRHYTYSLTLN
ncbi:SusE domain-containing protein [Psychroserpens sp. NJDZ02]|uniref:SusE domain-containing protein n=1 Tax=Psychroserpens sp. NJDZ02 TaxID=2570561 RepID=UPI0010A91768|nr:SusE domain-containing protein [Psychroserpens sp. NJDZ02]QCE41548.1 SusF/SusE family outer membrane protein [Psychroserpens sp. NJDZ02]